MKEYYSKAHPGVLLHVVVRRKDVLTQKDFRKDIISPDQDIQCCSLKMDAGHTFKPHKHILKSGQSLVRAQESWVVIRGSVMCVFYDLDDTVLNYVTLGPGDASFTLNGGHTYEILEDSTMVYEFKTGPYTGQEDDKVFI